MSMPLSVTATTVATSVLAAEQVDNGGRGNVTWAGTGAEGRWRAPLPHSLGQRTAILHVAALPVAERGARGPAAERLNGNISSPGSEPAAAG